LKRRRKSVAPKIVAQAPKPVVDNEARAARERAEQALRDVRERRAASEALGRWFRGDALENHYARDLQDLLLGRKP